MNPLVRTTLTVLVLGTLMSLACSGTSSERANGDRVESPGDAPPQIDMEEVERLRALGYLNVGSALPPDAEVGVVSFDRERTAEGLNLFTNAKFCSAQLIGMDGRVHHSWSREPCFRWGNAVLTPSGDLLVVVRLPHENAPSSALETRYLLRMNWDGDVVWEKQLPVHHDVEVTPRGQILTLTYDFRVIPEVHPEIPVRENLAVLLDDRGDVVEEVSLWDVLRSAPDVFTMQKGKERYFEGGQEVDLFHANSIEWLRHPELVGTHPIYRPGSVLICMRHQDTLAIFDWETKRLLWAWGQGEISGPHDATLLPNGNILAFDNGLGRGFSRVIEIDPIEREIVWEYVAPDRESFYSETRGANQRLANANTLITESDEGRAIEVTPDGTIVWEFINPNMTEKREPSVIVRFRRLEGLEYDELARRIASGGGLPYLVD